MFRSPARSPAARRLQLEMICVSSDWSRGNCQERRKRFMTNKQRPSFGPDGGDHYELNVDLGPFADAAALLALQAIWQHPSVLGPYRLLNQAPDSQPVWTDAPWQVGRTYGGVLVLPRQIRLTFHAILLRRDRGAPVTHALSVRFSPREIDRAYGFPPHQGGYENWQPETDQSLVDLAQHVHRRVPVHLGGVGFEILALSLKDKHYDFLIPEGSELRWQQRRKRG